ncbi:MAG: hypothetical protein R3F14_42270 [Polyangiaceae bacterium]
MPDALQDQRLLSPHRGQILAPFLDHLFDALKRPPELLERGPRSPAIPQLSSLFPIPRHGLKRCPAARSLLHDLPDVKGYLIPLLLSLPLGLKVERARAIAWEELDPLQERLVQVGGRDLDRYDATLSTCPCSLLEECPVRRIGAQRRGQQDQKDVCELDRLFPLNRNASTRGQVVVARQDHPGSLPEWSKVHRQLVEEAPILRVVRAEYPHRRARAQPPSIWSRRLRCSVHVAPSRGS